MKKILIIALISLFFPSWALCETAESKSSPPILQQIAPDSWYYNYNIQEIQKEDGTFYQYNYVEIQGKPTKAKVIAALKYAGQMPDQTEADVNTGPNFETAKDDFTNNILTSKTKAELNDYIDANWTNLTDSKATFKKLVELVYDFMKQLGY